MKGPYEILGVAKTATADEIKKAYRKLAKECHPDLNPGDKNAQARFQEIGEAYDILSNPLKRREYDAKAARQEPSQDSRQKQRENPKGTRTPTNPDFDISNMQGFESFFGFNPKTGDITDERKINSNAAGKKKNPMDTSDIFSKFMGFK